MQRYINAGVRLTYHLRVTTRDACSCMGECAGATGDLFGNISGGSPLYAGKSCKSGSLVERGLIFEAVVACLEIFKGPCDVLVD